MHVGRSAKTKKISLWGQHSINKNTSVLIKLLGLIPVNINQGYKKAYTLRNAIGVNFAPLIVFLV